MRTIADIDRELARIRRQVLELRLLVATDGWRHEIYAVASFFLTVLLLAALAA